MSAGRTWSGPSSPGLRGEHTITHSLAHSLSHSHAHARARKHAHARTRVRAHTHTHTQSQTSTEARTPTHTPEPITPLPPPPPPPPHEPPLTHQTLPSTPIHPPMHVRARTHTRRGRDAAGGAERDWTHAWKGGQGLEIGQARRLSESLYPSRLSEPGRAGRASRSARPGRPPRDAAHNAQCDAAKRSEARCDAIQRNVCNKIRSVGCNASHCIVWQYDAIRCDARRCNKMQQNAIRCNRVLRDAISAGPGGCRSVRDTLSESRIRVFGVILSQPLSEMLCPSRLSESPIRVV